MPRHSVTIPATVAKDAPVVPVRVTVSTQADVDEPTFRRAVERALTAARMSIPRQLASRQRHP